MAGPSVALVVGANRGIGLGVVREFLRRGWSVIATARHPDAAAACNRSLPRTRGSWKSSRWT